MNEALAPLLEFLDVLFDGVQVALGAYLVLLTLANLSLGVLALVNIRRHRDLHSFDIFPRAHGEFSLPVSLLVPAYNEAAGIGASVRSLLLLEYPQFEVVVINDGSKDNTLASLIQEFDLQPFPEANELQLPCAEILAVYRSRRHPNLRVVDKRNGGKADALNAGINCARHPLFCAVDADSILRRDSLSRAVKPFLEDSRTVVVGASIGIANGCTISGGQLERVAIAPRFLAAVQVLEYLRAFLIGRLGWTPLNALLIISGAFGVFDKHRVINAGGYRAQTIGEDMELTVRLHEIYRLEGRPYRIRCVPDPLCWTEAPESLQVLRSQRTRWQRGLAESLMTHRKLWLNRRSGPVGWLAVPFFLMFEFFSPAIEVFGYLGLLGGVALGLVSVDAFFGFMLMAISLGILMSMQALLLEALSAGLYHRPRQVLALAAVALIENLGYRQLVMIWRLQGMWRWARGTQQQWGTMTRTAALGGNAARAPAAPPPEREPPP